MCFFFIESSFNANYEGDGSKKMLSAIFKTWSLPVFPKIQFDDFDKLIFLLQVWPERPQIKLDIHELLFHIIGFSPTLHLSNR